jgi:hypothetical protein
MYNVLKFIVTVLLPGAGALYFGLSQIWGLPFADELNGTINLVAVFLGLILGYSTRSYNRSDDKFDGDLRVEERNGQKYVALQFNGPPESVVDKSEVTFRNQTS